MSNLIEKDGYWYKVSIINDPYMGPPWKEDGGMVSEWTSRSKQPGEKVLYSDHGLHLYYDFTEAVYWAREEGWGVPKVGETKHQTAARIAEEYFQRMKAYCQDEWGYVTVTVTECRTDPDGFEYDGPSESAGGVESDDQESIKYLSHQLIGKIRAEYPKKEEKL